MSIYVYLRYNIIIYTDQWDYTVVMYYKCIYTHPRLYRVERGRIIIIIVVVIVRIIVLTVIHRNYLRFRHQIGSH